LEKESSLDVQTLHEKIYSILRRNKYIIKHSAKNSIQFKDNFWRIRPSWVIWQVVDKGKFDVVSLPGGVSLIRYTYYISFIPEATLAMVSLILCLMFHFPYSFMILPTPFVIGHLLRIGIMVDVCKKMIRDIADPGKYVTAFNLHFYIYAVSK